METEQLARLILREVTELKKQLDRVEKKVDDLAADPQRLRKPARRP
ncbi:MAG: hypothetical protein LAP40_23490 [Acidobacteriia bacterium]|nr:hypothetical protein [Terriglobia bacterium]